MYTILRLPTGIFYAAGVKNNVLFFERGKTDKDNTKEVWFYDMRTNMPAFGKRTPFTEKHFADFEKAYNSDRTLSGVEVKDERWKSISREDIALKNDSLDLGLIADDSIIKTEDIGEPIDIAKEALSELDAIIQELNAIMKELN